MTNDSDLTPEQRAALDPNIRLIEACPGAGKTRTIIQRFKDHAVESNRAVALLSFTNAAVDEARSRCRDRVDLLRSPHFIGTFDTFLHRYIVTPSVGSALGKSPTYYQSWDELPATMNQVSINRSWKSISLSNFSHESGGTISLLVEGLKREERQLFESLENDRQLQTLIQSGTDKIRAFNASGIYDSDSARWKALVILRSERGNAVLTSLVKRFSHIIVDEFQDCATLEHEFLEILTNAGIRITVVADPDQSIFAFRQVESEAYANYRATIANIDVVTLTTNFRSSPVICEFVQNLRFEPATVMISGQIDRIGNCSSIYLLGGTDEEIRSRFLSLADSWGVPFDQRISLAHRRSDASSLGGGGKSPPRGDGNMLEMLKSLSILITSGSAVIRREALVKIERLVTQQFEWTSEQNAFSTKQKLELLGKNELWVRLMVADILSDIINWNSPDSVGVSIRRILEEFFRDLPIPIRGALGRRFAKPNAELWRYWCGRNADRDVTAKLAWSTIHASKGQEFDAVLLKIPASVVMVSWLAGVASEERRVFYVGASRARKLLVLAVSANRFQEVKGQLESLSLPIVCESL
ncbi:MAG: ATP-dependent helicase [Candidatus Planktophila sp.]|nr:ATP-dependent helicase [Candidatus Planktophila sp.]